MNGRSWITYGSTTSLGAAWRLDVMQAEDGIASRAWSYKIRGWKSTLHGRINTRVNKARSNSKDEADLHEGKMTLIPERDCRRIGKCK